MEAGDASLHYSMMNKKITTKIIGLGNPILGDDGVGHRVADEIARQLEKNNQFMSQTIQVEKASLGGLSLMELLIDSDRAIIIDSIETNQNPVGTVRNFNLDELPDQIYGHTTSSHDTTLSKAIQVGKLIGAHLPEPIFIVSIEAHNLYEFSERLSPSVEQAIPKACQSVWQYLEELEKEL